MVQQLAMAEVLQCDSAMIDLLTTFANDRQRIRDRLQSGLGINARVEPHFLIFD